jgi:hypothetical protein
MIYIQGGFEFELPKPKNTLQTLKISHSEKESSMESRSGDATIIQITQNSWQNLDNLCSLYIVV